jgi:CUB domain
MKSEKNATILINPNYPQPYSGGSRCVYRIYRRAKKICQLRIDFLMFSLAQPSGDGFCSTDYFTVEGGSTSVPKICGENTGQHVYVEVTGKLPVSIVVASNQTKDFNRRWLIQVSQVKCKSKYRGC